MASQVITMHTTQKKVPTRGNATHEEILVKM